MKLFNKIIKDSKSLYFIFIAILMITNVALLFTETMTVSEKIAFILLPLGIQMFIVALFYKPGLAFLVMLPKSILDAFQLVLIKLYGGSFIAADMFLNVVTTNMTEVEELLTDLAQIILIILIIYIPAIILSVRSIRQRIKLERGFRYLMIKVSGAVIALGIVSFIVAGYKNEDFKVRSNIYPVNVICNMDYAIKKWNRISSAKENMRNFSYNAYRDSAGSSREIFVLVIGETARAANWSLYGYERKTTPNMDTLSNLIVFEDALSQSNTTHKSVPLLMTPANADNHSLIYKCKSVVSLFKEAGFKTAYLSNHNYQQTFMDNYFGEADIKVSIKDAALNSYDYALLDPLSEILWNHKDDDLFIVIHLYGSHFKYSQRYTEEFAKFLPDVVESISPEFKQQLVNSYDNSILSTDYVLHNIIESVKGCRTSSSVLYVSDHGEDLMDDHNLRFLHASPIPTFNQLHVPFVIWFSDEYKKEHSQKYSWAVTNSSKPVSTSITVFHTLGDLANIRSEYLNRDLSVCSDSIKIEPRKYLTDHDTSASVEKLLR